MIRFPQMSIATSVVNRIINASRDLAEPADMAPAVPSMPDAGPLGAVLDTAIAEPTPAVAPIDPTMAEDVTTQTLFQ